MKKHLHPLLCMLGLAAALALPISGRAQQAADDTGRYSSNGADSCLKCHDEDEGAKYSAGAIFKSKHGHRGDKRSPFGAGGLQCEACHGPGATHVRNKRAEAIVSFKADSKATLEQRNQLCMGCHQGSTRNAWHAGAHERANLACTDCHKMHRERGDPVLAKASESQVCMSCHKTQRADFQKTSSHPLRQGKMACSDCHAPHGSGHTAMLAKPTLNQTCTSCHADKRGPLLWEHAPVSEDCSLCHQPHGSVRPALLAKSAPLLCQQCHSAAGHPSIARTGSALPAGGGIGAIFAIAGSCTNCHTQVHGSNHPSGAKLMR